MSRPLFLCLFVPEFPAQALLRLRPALHHTPVAVLEGATPLETVASVNGLARRLGIVGGMRKSELSTFPALTLLRRSEAEEQASLAAASDIAATLTPRIERITSATLRNDPGLSANTQNAVTLILDITGCERLFGPPAAIARRLLRGLRSVHIAARTAVSSNFSAAVCLARAATRGVTVVPAEETAAALSSLPLSALPLTPQEMETLSLWGLRSLGELAALPRLDLVTRLGSAGEHLHQLALGTAPHLMVPAESPLRLEEVIEFDSPVETIDSLLFVLGPMLDALIARAAAHALELSSVTAHMTLEEFGTASSETALPETPERPATHTRTLKPALPVADRSLLLKLFQLDLAAHPPAAGVRLLRLTATPGARSKVQAGLFTPQTPEPLRLEVTLARLAALVGEGRVGRPELADSNAPESFTLKRFTVPATQPNRTSSRRLRHGNSSKRSRPQNPSSSLEPTAASPAHAVPADRKKPVASAGFSQPANHTGVALRRFRPPVPISPRSESGTLLAFFFQGVRYEVRERFGPWRRSGQWWSGEIWSREEWDIHAEPARTSTPSGTAAPPAARLLCLVSHDLLHDRWHMDAVYD